MRIIVCVKEVLDPNAVNNYALAGKLTIGADGRTLEVAAVPRLINGYDEQAIAVRQHVELLAGAICLLVRGDRRSERSDRRRRGGPRRRLRDGSGSRERAGRARTDGAGRSRAGAAQAGESG